MRRNIGYKRIKNIKEILGNMSKIQPEVYSILAYINKKEICEKLGMSRSGFYSKLKRRCFSVDEMKMIIDAVYESKEQSLDDARIKRLIKYRKWM